MSASYVSLDFADITKTQAYEILVATIQPRPIAFVSTVSKLGHQNLAPFSFFTIGGSNPPSVVFSPTIGPNGPKDTLRNIEETGEFVINLVHRRMSDQMNLTSKGYPHEISEWEMAGFDQIQSIRVKPPRIVGSLVQLECRLFQVISHGEGVGAARYVIGEVLVAHLADQIWDGNQVLVDQIRPIARMGGPHYLDTDELAFFQMHRPT